MADELDIPQSIASTFDEEALRLLSLAQNGAAAIQREEDGAGNLTGFLSLFPIDLTDYATLAPAVPVSVTKAQAKIQLHRTPGSVKDKTLLDDVKAAVEAAGVEVEIWFSDATLWERANPYVAQLGGVLKLTDEQIDELFVAAAKIAA